ncbi:MAG: leucine-rich repeat domain-containing protein [Ruminococcus sp.]|nr:leucine-rich repeat domain-containing protein [Ruminococcus sp.]
MKTKTTSIITSIIMVIGMIGILPVMTASAYQSGGYYYEYDNISKTAIIITGYYGTDGDLVIPSEINDVKVTKIADEAFCDEENPNKVIKTVTIPKTITYLGSKAFAYCQELTRVDIPASVTSTINRKTFLNCFKLENINVDENNSNYYSIDGVLFKKNKTGNYLILYPRGRKDLSYTVPDGVIVIENSAFIYSKIESISLPESLGIIGSYAFLGSKLKSVDIPDNVRSIDSHSFKNCDNLTSIVIPNNTDRINPSAFEDCNNLERVVLSDNTTEICEYAFKNCTSLSEIHMPNLKTIRKYAFEGCTSLETLRLPEGFSYIGSYAISKCSGLKTAFIPSTLRDIGAWGFKDCTNLIDVEIAEGVKGISEESFNGCTSLKNINLPKSLWYIGKQAFENCYNLEGSFVISGSVEKIWHDAFSGCKKIENITIGNGVEEIYDRAFLECENLKSVTIPSTVTNIDMGAFNVCNNLSDVYYYGTQAQWEAISIDSYNEPLLNATIHFMQPTAELKYQIRENDDGTTDVRAILIADEDDVLAADSASVYATVDGTDTDTIVVDRAYRSIIAGGQKLVADEGKVFLIGKILGVPADMVSGMTAHFTLDENTFERTIN